MTLILLMLIAFYPPRKRVAGTESAGRRFIYSQYFYTTDTDTTKTFPPIPVEIDLGKMLAEFVLSISGAGIVLLIALVIDKKRTVQASGVT